MWAKQKPLRSAEEAPRGLKQSKKNTEKHLYPKL